MQERQLTRWGNLVPCDDGKRGSVADVSDRDYNLALKYFLRATEMQTDPSRPETSGPGKTRSWWGVRLVSCDMPDRDHPEIVPLVDTAALGRLFEREEHPCRVRHLACTAPSSGPTCHGAFIGSRWLLHVCSSQRTVCFTCFYPMTCMGLHCSD